MRQTSDHNVEQNDDINKVVNVALDHSVDKMSDKVLTDITQARKNALSLQQNEKPKSHALFEMLISVSFIKITAPIALVTLITLSIKTHNVEQIPSLPVAMVNQPMPGEDLTLLEDLEFITWLAENEHDALL